MQTLKNHYMDAGFALKKAFIDNQSQCKKLGIFFLFSFSFRPTDPSNFEKNPCSQKLNWSGLIAVEVHCTVYPTMRKNVLCKNIGKIYTLDFYFFS